MITGKGILTYSPSIGAASTKVYDEFRIRWRSSMTTPWVHGLEGLRVINASVMPAATSTDTDAPTIIKGVARERLAA
jgi:hypothetical protein